jgi:tRNA-Thr(GGU) m(6)t(6)A37 methyltransferase TsaA
MRKLESERLLLYPLSSQQLTKLLNQPESLVQELGFPIAKSIIDANVQRAIQMKLDAAGSLDENEWLWKTYWLIKIKHQDFGAGLIGFKGKSDHGGYVEIGYGIDESDRNKGYMTEAVQLMLDWAFEKPECNCVMATTVINPASERVLQKLHFINVARSEKSSNWYHFKQQTSSDFSSQNYHFQPIGIIYSPHEQAEGTPIQPSAASDFYGTIRLDPKFKAGLKDLTGFSHIILIYVFDRAKAPKLTIKPFMDSMERGLFATRAPSRPNPVGLSVVELLGIEDNILYIKNVDILNRTPLLDITPYVPHFDPKEADRIGWLGEGIQRLENAKDDGRFIRKKE